ncbi:hypothetical protein [Glaciibacter psychrotolerans]|uniref:Cell division protein FtsL n=1 Tax=Glaciibacter psychrotolerans TaxID=670054 RepID=A0A7Z0EDA5_9MICO|nr:hypothetical protein [Leifsonia psychrotolerans]NYJ18812.1 hypothetical protein [Leifsonia psychrotolerans]
MSDNLARVMRPAALPEHTIDHGPAQRQLHIVTTRSQRKARPRIIYAFTAITGIVVIICVQLLVSVGVSQGAYQISSLQNAQVELSRTAESVRENLVRVSSPQALSANAEALGMVSNSNPVYLRLSDGAVLGAPSAATASGVKAAALVPNSLLVGMPLVTQIPQTDVPVAGPAPSPAGATAPAPAPAPVAPAPPTGGGLPTPTTR